MLNFLCLVVIVICGELLKLWYWVKEVKVVMVVFDIDLVFVECSVNEGFFGGEKKCYEIL